LFHTKYHVLLKTGCIAWGDLNSEDAEILSILQIVQERLEGTVFRKESVSEHVSFRPKRPHIIIELKCRIGDAKKLK